MNLPREYFVCVARYHEVKDHRTLLNAYKTYVTSGGLWDLVLVGDGPLRVAIAELVEHLGLRAEFTRDYGLL
jgi:glycosyltransferase involved in cell wall biosynthesis